MNSQRTSLEVAEEITQPQADLLNDFERTKDRHKIEDAEGGMLPRCSDIDLPRINFDMEKDDPFDIS